MSLRHSTRRFRWRAFAIGLAGIMLISFAVPSKGQNPANLPGIVRGTPPVQRPTQQFGISPIVTVGPYQTMPMTQTPGPLRPGTQAPIGFAGVGGVLGSAQGQGGNGGTAGTSGTSGDRKSVG